MRATPPTGALRQTFPASRPVLRSSSFRSLPLSLTPAYFSPVPASDTLQARVERALSQLQNPRRGNDVLTAGMVKDLAVAGDGTVTLTFLLGRDDPASRVGRAGPGAGEGLSVFLNSRTPRASCLPR